MTKINDTFNHVKRTGSVMLKIFLIGFLTLLFLIPLEMISGVTTERAAYRDKAIDSVIQGWADEQVISGPVIVIPNIAPLKKRTEPAYFILTPRRLEVTGDIKTDMRYRGIYQVPVYKAVLKMRGDFNGSALPLSPEFASDKAFISFGIRDVRGIGNDLIVTWNNEKVSPKPGTGFSQWSKGFHIPLKQRIDTKKPTSFAVNMTLRGAQSFAVTPLGKETRVELSSNWQHPNFQGRFLPLKRDINDKGFSATWETGELATGGTVDSAAQRVTRSRSAVTNTVIDSYTSNDTSTSADENTNFSVSFYQPNDIYQQANRATKYGILFIIVTFVAFFVFEAMKQLRIHAIQYILVGAALAVFYLIVLSLSEHIAFAWAYLIAAATTIGLLWFYIGYVVHSHRVALFFAALLSIFYALMYVILTTEDYALLLGTGLTLSLVAGMMIVTRHINWYAVGDAKD